MIVALIVWLKPIPLSTSAPTTTDSVAPHALTNGAATQIGYQQLRPVLAQRCYLCHGELVQMKNIRLDSPQNVKAYAQYMYQQVVVTRLMPMNNATGITEAERQLIKQWFEGGANTQ
jgi:uncharacterized membrane protein